MTEDQNGPDLGDLQETIEAAHPPVPLTRRFALVFSSPSAAFVGLRRERWIWIWPALVIALCMTIAPRFVADLHAEKQIRAMEEYVDRGLVQEDGAEELRERILDRAEGSSPVNTILMTILGTAFTILLRFLLPGALLLLGVRFVMEGSVGYPGVLAALSFASLPAAVREIARTPLQMAKGSLDVSFGPAFLTGTEGVGRYALGLLDLFDLWIVYLLIVGLSVVGPISRARSAALVLPLWIVFSLFKIGLRASPFGAAF